MTDHLFLALNNPIPSAKPCNDSHQGNFVTSIPTTVDIW